jgi:creatinine amidohydrolase
MNYGELNWPQVPDASRRVAIVPLGSMEQHGRHLPLLTDSMIGAEIVRRAQEALGDLAVVLPMLWIGASDHHRAYPGTVTINVETYTKVVGDILESLVRSGFERILVLNAHGGNILPGKRAVYDVRTRHHERKELWLVFATWFELAAPQVAAIDELEQRRVSHASELETSMILRLQPELVDMSAAVGAVHDFQSAFYSPDSRGALRIATYPPLDARTVSGALGKPELATAEKGEALYQVAVGEVVALVREMASWPVLEPV